DAIRNTISAARSAIDNVISRVRAIGERLVDDLISAVDRAASWLHEKLATLADSLIALGRRILALAGKVRQLLAGLGSKVPRGIADRIEDPLKFTEPFMSKVGEWMAGLPGAANQPYDQYVSPLFGGSPGPEAADAAAAGGPVLQRQAAGKKSAPAPAATGGA